MDAMPALRMNSGVGSSGSPTQKGTMSLRPSPSFTSSRILEAVSERTAARAMSGDSGFIWENGFYETLAGGDHRAVHGRRPCARPVHFLLAPGREGAEAPRRDDPRGSGGPG